MDDTQEEEALELPELNERRIEVNAVAIHNNKVLVRSLLIVVLWMAGTIAYLINKQHNLERCSAVLYTHLTKQKAPDVHHDLFEDDCKH